MTTDFQKIIRGLLKEVSSSIIAVGVNKFHLRINDMRDITPSDGQIIKIMIRGRECGLVIFDNDVVRVLKISGLFIFHEVWAGHLADPNFCEDFKKFIKSHYRL